MARMKFLLFSILFAGPLMLSLCEAAPLPRGTTPASYDDNNPRSWKKGTSYQELGRLLGLPSAMVTVESNTTPKDVVNPLPNPKNYEQCRQQWETYFSKKKVDSPDERACCSGLKNCDCLKQYCNSKKHDPGCNGVQSADKCKGTSCKGRWTMQQCLALPDAPSGSSTIPNWLWILIAIAVIMIILICVAICCVYNKKFSGKHDTKKDKRKAHISVGPMNVSSKVHWEGKKKHKGGSRKASRNSVRGSSSKQSRKQSGASVSRGASKRVF